ncbi:MAG: glycosyltransferase [Muribaculaceae bacterium]|nr:glycosyltransferase [Muribaculaceae bacterium]
MQRIIVIIPQYLGGGAETVTDSIVKALKPAGFEFILITEKVIEKCRERVEALYSEIIFVDFELARYSPKTTAALCDVIEPLKGNVLWMISDDLPDIPKLRARLAPGGKVIYHHHNVPLFQAIIKDSYRGKKSDRAAYLKWFLLKHMREKLFRSYTRRYIKRALQTATDVDAYITLTNGFRSQLTALHPQCADKFRAIYNPVAAKPDEVNLADKRREVIYLGRLSYPDKRVDRLLRIFAKVAGSHPGWKLRLVGDGPERANLEQLAADLKIQNIEFCGFSQNPAEYLKSASIICLTSEYEGWPMALVEGMLYKAAPIAFGCTSGVRELLADGRGIVIEPGDEARFAAELSQLMASPEERREIVEANASFLNELSIEKIAGQWRELFLS